MQIAGREISNRLPPYIVAEISCNHCGKLDWALNLIEEAKWAGADAVKFQCYQADTLTLDCDKPDFICKDGPWKGRRLHELYSKTQTPHEWFPKLFELGRTLNITVFSSVFQPEEVDFLEKLYCPAYKIASCEIADTNLIAYAAKTGKPLIISTGMASYREAQEAYSAAKEKPENICFLRCVSGYPTSVADADLRRHQSPLDVIWGLSDHTLGWEVPVAATALGAVMIEKHLMLDCTSPEDNLFSMTPAYFSKMCTSVRAIWQAIQPSERKSEESTRQFRRSLYVVKDIKAGDLFTPENVRSIRPAYGLPPSTLKDILGKPATIDLERGTPLEWQYVSGS